MNKSKWLEIRNKFFNEEEQCFCIDGYKTKNDNEEGKTIAKIYLNPSKEIVYLDDNAITDQYVQESIKEIVMILKKETIKQDLRIHINNILDDYKNCITDTMLDQMVDDVLETSAMEHENFYNNSDIILAFQRVICNSLETK